MGPGSPRIWYQLMESSTLLKFNMEPEKKSSEKDIPFGNHHVQVPCYFLGEYFRRSIIVSHCHLCIVMFLLVFAGRERLKNVRCGRNNHTTATMM